MVSPHFSIFFWSWSSFLDCTSQGRRGEHEGEEREERRGGGGETRKRKEEGAEGWKRK